MEEIDIITKIHEDTAWNSYYTNVGESIFSVNNRFSALEVERPPSVREFHKTTPPPLQEIISVLKRVYCIDKSGRAPTPSAGNINKVELHLISYPMGLIYEISSDGVIPFHELSKDTCENLIYNQINGEGWLILFSADLYSYVKKYGTRSYRFVLLEAGHLCQALIQEFDKASIQSCPIGGFNDYLCEDSVLTGLDNYFPLYILAVGYKPEC